METLAGAVSRAVTVTIRISQTVYELKAVDQQARDLLETTAHVNACIGTVRSLRRQKSALLCPTLKKWIDRVIIDTDKAVQNVAALIEPARVDMRANFGKVSLKNKFAFVLRDSPRVGTNLHRLNIVHRSLSNAMGILSAKDSSIAELEGGGDSRPIRNANADPRPPPAYEEIMQLRRERKKSISSSVTMRSLPQTGDDSTSMDSPVEKEAYELVSEVVITTDQLASIPTPAQQEPPKSGFIPDDGLIAVEACGELPAFHIDPPNSHRNSSSMDGADGPQVVMSDLPELVEDFDDANMDPNSRMSLPDWQSAPLPPRFPRPHSLLNVRTGSGLPNHNIPAQLLPGQASLEIGFNSHSRNPSYPGSSKISLNSTANNHRSYPPPSDPELFLQDPSSTTSLASVVSNRSTYNFTSQSPPQVSPTNGRVRESLQPQTQTRPQSYIQYPQPRPDTPLESNAPKGRSRLSGKERKEAWLAFHANQ